jgi:hypothetical protein
MEDGKHELNEIQMDLRQPSSRSFAYAMAILAALASSQVRADIVLQQAASYAILFEGAGGNTLQITNVSINGSVGVGMTGKATDSGPSTIKGGLNFSATNTGQFSNNNGGNVITGGVSYNVGGVTSALNWVNGLNSTYGAMSGTNISINGSTTINLSSYTPKNGNIVLNVTGFNTTNNDVITINGDAAHDNVIFNFTGNANFNNQVVLNGIDDDSVLWNFVGGSGLTGGPTLQINTNASSHPNEFAHGIFLDPNGPVSVTNANILGRIFGGDTHDFQYVSGSLIDQPSPVPEPSTLALVFSGLPALIGVGYARMLRRRSAA